MDLAAGDVDADRLVVHANLVDAVGLAGYRRCADQQRGEWDAGRDLGQVGWQSHAVGAPAGELSEHRLQRLPGLGQLVPLRPPLSDPSHDSVLLERAQTRREDVGADTAEPAQQLGVAARPEQQVPHDQKRPALADDVERRAGWTE